MLIVCVEQNIIMYVNNMAGFAIPVRLLLVLYSLTFMGVQLTLNGTLSDSNHSDIDSHHNDKLVVDAER